MARADRGADLHWKACMLASGVMVARSLPYFTTDEVVAYCKEHHPNATTHELRAIGPVMQRLAGDGACAKTEHYRESSHEPCNQRPKLVWQSLIYETPPWCKKAD